MDAELVTDPGGKKTSSWRTHRMCLEACPADATHLLVLQDDAWPCDGFADAARAAISERPGAILCLFAPGFSWVTRTTNLARKQGERWMPWRIRGFVPLVAVVYPAAFPREILAYLDGRRAHYGRADDALIGSYARAFKRPVWATVPSLVQHRDEMPSVMRMPHGRGQPHRLAAFFAEDGGAWACASAVAV